MFNEILIDLVYLGTRVPSQAESRFGFQIAMLACDVLHRDMNSQQLRGVTDCIGHLFENLTWQTTFLGFPTGRKSYLNTSFCSEDYYRVMPNSVVATVLKYSYPSSDGYLLSEKLVSQLASGIEVACINALKHDYIHLEPNVKLMDPIVIAKFVSHS